MKSAIKCTLCFICRYSGDVQFSIAQLTADILRWAFAALKNRDLVEGNWPATLYMQKLHLEPHKCSREEHWCICCCKESDWRVFLVVVFFNHFPLAHPCKNLSVKIRASCMHKSPVMLCKQNRMVCLSKVQRVEANLSFDLGGRPFTSLPDICIVPGLHLHFRIWDEL